VNNSPITPIAASARIQPMTTAQVSPKMVGSASVISCSSHKQANIPKLAFRNRELPASPESCQYATSKTDSGKMVAIAKTPERVSPSPQPSVRNSLAVIPATRARSTIAATAPQSSHAARVSLGTTAADSDGAFEAAAA
jgi:hypothetical protein